ncbi:MAG: response regulator [Deltaproteobacteria bacterium]|nr:response regulator [Deltaproteobacteria bacterium]
MKSSIKFPNSIQLFEFVRKIADDVFLEEPLSDVALGRIMGLEGARTSRWKYGQISVTDSPRLLALSEALNIDLYVLTHVASGYMSAKEAINLLSDSGEFLRFLGDQLVLPQNENTLTLIDADGAEARIVRNSPLRYTRKFRRAQSARPVSKDEQKRIFLLADDDPTAIEIFNNITGHGTGVEGIVAKTMPEALLMAGKYRPHMIVLDLFLSGADGFETLRALNAMDDIPIRIIATSTVMTQAVLTKAKGCGASTVIERPLRARNLGKLVRELRNG